MEYLRIDPLNVEVSKVADAMGAVYAERHRVLTGVVKEFQWTNPHTWVELDITTPDGTVEGWSLEGGSINAIKRQGWTRTSLKPGDKVKVLINPLLDGKKGGALRGIVLPDGTLRGKAVDPQSSDKAAAPR